MTPQDASQWKRRLKHPLTTQHVSAPLGYVEPHAGLLRVPPDDQFLYKILTVENLLTSVIHKYLHFNRVDSYPDSPFVDIHDGEQFPADKPMNASARFQKSPAFSLANYYDESRARTYAFCASLENTDHIWAAYGNGSDRGKVCVVFSFGKLRTRLNQTLQPGSAALLYNGVQCHQVFSLNYGIVDYIDWKTYRANTKVAPNPIVYTFMKDTQFKNEKELRISLSALGIGSFSLDDGTILQFPPNLQLDFDFCAAFGDGTIHKLLVSPDTDATFLKAELHKLNIIACA